MNNQEKIDEIFEMLSSKIEANEVTQSLLESIDKLDHDLRAANGIELEERVQLPYSSMPKLSKTCWK